MTEPIKVDIWSDVACPWCFIGKRRFEAAAEQFDGVVEIEYHSYELSPDTPEDYAGSSREYLVGRGFPADQIDAMHARVSQVAATIGLEYDFDANRPTRTLKAHELIHFAKEHGRQAEMKDRLLQGYFERGEHLGDRDELVRLAGEVGLDEDAARNALESGEYAAAVQDDIAAARRIGVQGVPFFVLNGKYGVSGAQEVETFVGVLNRVRDEAAAQE